MRAIISVGISGSGKSTEFNRSCYDGYVRIERDVWRKRILEERGKWNDNCTENFWSVWEFTKENEAKVTEKCNEIIEDCIAHKMPLIISDTNLNKVHRDALVKRLMDAGYVVELKVFDVDIMEAIRRDELRRDSVGHQVIWKQYQQFREQFPKKQYVADGNKPKCILVDLDGTLAHMNGKRGAFEWDKVGLDDVDDAVRMMCFMTKFAYQQDHFIDVKNIILSGRDEICKAETEKWLAQYGVVYDKLIMRPKNDMRKDTVVKEEIFWRDIAPNYDVLYVIDDRPSVCRMWRDIGLKVFQVGNPHVEF